MSIATDINGMPLDPNAPSWEWPPPHWPQSAAPIDPTLQPGLGIPTNTVDAAFAQNPPPPIDPNAQPVDPTTLGLGIQPAGVDPIKAQLAGPEPMPWEAAHPGWDSDPSAPPGPPQADTVSQADSIILPHDFQFAPNAHVNINRSPVEPTPAGMMSDEQRMAAEQARVDALSPEDLAVETALHERAAKNEGLRRQAEESEKSYHKLLENQRIRDVADKVTQQKSDELVADAQRIADTKIDPGRAWANRSVPGKIAGVLQAMIGGLITNQNGGRNIGLDLLQKEVDQDIDAQKADLANQWQNIGTRKGAVAEEFARHGNAYQAAETVRLAAWTKIEADLASEQQKYDPNGTTALMIANTRMGVRARQAALIQAHAVATNKLAEDAAKAKLEADKFAEAKRKALEDEKTARANTASSNWGHAITKQGQEQAAEQARTVHADAVAALADAKTTKAAEKVAENVQKFGVPGVLNKDGTPFLAKSGSETELAAVRLGVGSSKNAVRIMDEIARKRAGWSTEAGNSKENQELRALGAELNLELKSPGMHNLGVIAGPDEGLMNDARGFSDPTKYRSIKAGLAEGRKNIIAKLDSKLKALGYQDTFDIKDYQQNKAEAKPGDAAAEATLADWKHLPSDQVYSELGLDSNGRDPDDITKSVAQATVDKLQPFGGMLPSQKATIDSWAKDLESADQAVRDLAVERLDKTASDSQNDNIKAYARSKIGSALHPTVGGDPEGPVTNPDYKGEAD